MFQLPWVEKWTVGKSFERPSRNKLVAVSFTIKLRFWCILWPMTFQNEETHEGLREKLCLRNLFSRSIIRSLLGGEMFTGIAEHDAWHLCGVFIEECGENLRIDSFSHFSQHPSHRFVHQVLPVVEKSHGQFQGGREVARFDEGEGGDDRGTALPKTRGRREIEQHFARAMEKKIAQQMFSRGIDQIPIVHSTSSQRRLIEQR